ncbi:CPBP family glutamic-type intramembrane protease [Clostridium kluyveri]|uniref:CAAX prenyl protease 2/Lysostaphin resistance protein A-like domain-containing protein n=1 Tax=Clostridium kluyveri TaxID=1534 RepID=A0A1L5FCV5_CLOKL|nr:CPBP family glutamic-type intramembrane protease [Clostridium kluyveri]APM40831.1 hypothetical protein BS101_20025 [Clostridium kluyveri]
MIKKLHNYLTNISMLKFILITSIVPCFISYIAFFLIENFVKSLPNDIVEINNLLITNISSAINGILFAPLGETLICQVIIIGIFLYYSYSKTIQIIAVIVSSICFGIPHFFNTNDVIWGLFWAIQAGVKGLIWGYAFIVYFFKSKRIDVAGFVVFLDHSINNLLSIVITFIFYKLL